MLAPPSAGFRRLLPLLKPHRNTLLAGGLCMLVFVACWPLLAWLAGQLIPAIGAGDFQRVLRVIGLALAVFMLQKVAQFGQDTLLAGPALQVSQELRRRLFARLQRLEFGALEKLSAGDLTYRLTEDADRVGEVIYKTIQDTTPSALQLVVVLGYMIWLDWPLALATLLDQYRTLRLDRMSGMKRRVRNQFELLVTQLQQRLLSSVEAFARTLAVHQRTLQSKHQQQRDAQLELLQGGVHLCTALGGEALPTAE